ncbi:antibiotic ABC transporter permease [Halostella sp. PRR32]|uniref:antibiotic ABC transporter permease n=1 Tax=Halostella sp. PRR32 TaxID=3098147 RepID=UPI002B1D5E6A|nr:antibiotic ABC transporter permease [Halostella sp. PRR32]
MTNAVVTDRTDRTGRVPSDELAARTLRDALAYSREQEYTGWDYCDGLSSRFLRALPVENKWLNVVVQETVKRSPVNVRPLFLVEQRRNFMGAGLFATANLVAERLADAGVLRVSGGVDYGAEAESLVRWLVDNRSTGYSGFCGGHKHRIQTLDALGRPNDPSVVSTAPAVRALLGAAERDPSYADIARSAADFVVDDLRYRDTDTGAVVDYHVQDSDEYYTVNAGAIAARLLLDLYERFGDDELRERATAILDHVAYLQTDRGGWHYRDPPDASHLSMDNFHNGFVIECFLRYADLVGSRYDDTIDDALAFYRTLFDASGAPDWDESSAYPRDVHACSQGILVFTYAGEADFARRILDWTLDELYAGDGRFYHRKGRFYTKRTTLMRWCQAWMCYALAEHLRVTSGVGGVAGVPEGVR